MKHRPLSHALAFAPSAGSCSPAGVIRMLCERCRMGKACICGKTIHERHQLDGMPWMFNCSECSRATTMSNSDWPLYLGAATGVLYLIIMLVILFGGLK